MSDKELVIAPTRQESRVNADPIHVEQVRYDHQTSTSVLLDGSRRNRGPRYALSRFWATVPTIVRLSAV